MVYELIVTVTALGLLISGWVAFQALVRRTRPGLSADGDVLQGRFSCGGCHSFEECRIPEESIADSDVLKVDRVDELSLGRLVSVEGR